MIELISGTELAAQLRFEGTTSAFRKFCNDAEIFPVPGRRDCYDPIAVRHRLNCIQGIGVSQSAGSNALENSKERRHA